VKHAAPAVPPELRTELVHALTHEMERTFDPRRGGPWRTRAWIPPEERVPGKPFFGANEGAPPRLW
jgi:hypothetical protein